MDLQVLQPSPQNPVKVGRGWAQTPPPLTGFSRLMGWRLGVYYRSIESARRQLSNGAVVVLMRSHSVVLVLLTLRHVQLFHLADFCNSENGFRIRAPCLVRNQHDVFHRAPCPPLGGGKDKVSAEGAITPSNLTALQQQPHGIYVAPT